MTTTSNALHDINQLTMGDLLSQVREWSLRNFGDKQASDLGVVEELGELTHGLLKRFQGIRGFDNLAHFQAHIEDAFADMGIYLVNYSALNNIMIMPVTARQNDFSDRYFLQQMLLQLHLLVMHEFVVEADDMSVLQKTEHQIRQGQIVQQIWTILTSWSLKYNIAFFQRVKQEWIKVRARDWEKNKGHAHLVAAEGGTEAPQVPPAKLPTADLTLLPESALKGE